MGEDVGEGDGADMLRPRKRSHHAIRARTHDPDAFAVIGEPKVMCMKDIVANTITRIGEAITRFMEKLAITDSRDQVAVLDRKSDVAELDDGVNGGAEEGRARVGFALATTI